jgi:hypothetical protein
MSDERTKRSWLRVSLKTLLWLMTVAAAFFGGYSVSQRMNERRLAAVDEANRALLKERAALQAVHYRAVVTAELHQLESKAALDKAQRLEEVNKVLWAEAKRKEEVGKE